MSIHLHAMFGKITQIFKKSEKLVDPIDLSVLGVDVHSHFIPGTDDEAPAILLPIPNHFP